MAHLAVDEGELVVGHAFHEVAVVGDEQECARPAVEQALHRRKHIGVQVVSRLVQDEHVRLIQQNEHERQPALLAAGQVAHRLVLIVLREPEPFQELSRRHLLAVEHRAPRVARDHLAHPVVAELAQLVQMLRQHGETHGLADFHAPGIERLQPLDDAQKRCLADAVGAHNAVAIARADDPVDVVQDDAIPEAQRCALKVDHLLAETRHGHALELQLVAQGRHVGDERLGGGHVELGLRSPRTGAAGEPRQLAAQGVLALLLGQSLQAIPFHPLHDVSGEASLEGPGAPTVHLPHGLADLVEEPAVVGHHEQRPRSAAPAGLQVLGEPGDGAHIQVVGRLVQHEHVPVADEQPGQINPSTLAAGKGSHRRVPIHILEQPRDNGANPRVAGPLVFGDIPHHGPLHGVRVAQIVALAEYAHRNAAGADDTAVVHFHIARKHPQKRGFPIAVLARDADASPLVHPEGQPLEHRLRGEFHAHFFTTEKKRHQGRLSLPFVSEQIIR